MALRYVPGSGFVYDLNISREIGHFIAEQHFSLTIQNYIKASWHGDESESLEPPDDIGWCVPGTVGQHIGDCTHGKGEIAVHD